MRKLLAALSLFVLALVPLAANADSTVDALPTTTTSPIPSGACFYVDQIGVDTKLCPTSAGAWATAFGFGTGALASTGTTVGAIPLLATGGLLASSEMPALTGAITTPGGSLITTLSANAVGTSNIAASAVTYSKIQNEAASTLLGNPTGSPAAPSEITLAGGGACSFVGSTLSCTGGGGGTTITLAPGLQNPASAAYNAGSQTVTNAQTVAPQGPVWTAANTPGTQTVASTDGAKLWVATASGVTFQNINPAGVLTSSFSFGYDGTHTYSLTTVGGTASIYGCGSSGTTISGLNYASIIVPDASNNYECIPLGLAGSGTPAGATDAIQYNAGGGSFGAPSVVNSAVVSTTSGGVPQESTSLPSGISAPSFTVTTAFTATGLVTLGDLATQSTNTILVNATSGGASPTAQAVPSCSAAGDALNWTTNTGIGCATGLGAGAFPITIGSTSIAANSTTTTLVGLTLSSPVINGGTMGAATPWTITSGTPTVWEGLDVSNHMVTGVPTITLAPGLATTPSTYNSGTQTAVPGSTISTQLFYKAEATSCTINSTCNSPSTNDSALLPTFTAPGQTLTLPAPGAVGSNSYQGGWDGTNSYSVTAGGATIYGCGTSGTTVSGISYQTQFISDGTNWQCLPSGGGSGSGITQLTGAVTAGPGSGSVVTTIPAQALANGMTATTQTGGDNTTKLATDAFVLANAAGFSAASTQHGSAATTIGASEYNVSTCNSSASNCSGGAWSAPTTYTLPVSSTVSVNLPFNIADGAGVVTNTNTLTIAPGAGDTITVGNTSVAGVTLNFAGGGFRCLLNTTAKNWTCPGSLPNGASTQLLIGQGPTVPFAPVTVTGDTTFNAMGVTTTAKVNGVAYPASPAANQVCVTSSGIACVYGTADAALSSNVPLKNGANTYTSVNNFAGVGYAQRTVTHGTSVTVNTTTDGVIVVSGGSGATPISYTCPATPFMFEVTDGDGQDVSNIITITPSVGQLNLTSGITLHTSGATVPTFDRIVVHCDGTATDANSWVN